mgnify:FL=1
MGGDGRCQSASERAGEVVAVPVFELQDRGSQYPGMLPPDHGRFLRWRFSGAVEAAIGGGVGRDAASGAAIAGSRDHHRPALATQTTIESAKWMIAMWTHAGQQGFESSGKHPPDVHAGHGTRMKTDGVCGRGRKMGA